MAASRRVLWASALVPWAVGAMVWAVVQTDSAPDSRSPASGSAVRAIGSADRLARVPARPVRAAQPDWSTILDRLDRRRESAYATNDRASLGAVYVADSPVLRHDLAMLEAYAERGVRLTGVRLRTFDVQLLGQSGPYVRLRVVDRLDRPTAHGADGSVRLPRDRATPRVVVLRDATAGWRIAAVRRVEL
jgi:hypothetical protein